MSRAFTLDKIESLQQRLDRHPVYALLSTLPDLQVFMAHHAYSVWDFMSLIKFLQEAVAPAQVPWTPVGDASVRYFINQLVLEEESDETPAHMGDSSYLSHFELYCHAMQEVGADAAGVLAFVEQVRVDGIDVALQAPQVPAPSREFSRQTFEFIATGKPHVVAAALAFGREHVIPNMFRAFLRDMDISADDAPTFHFYLNRHIHLDEDFHGPLSQRMVEALCQGDEQRLREAEQAAEHAVAARLRFWDGVAAAINAA